MNQLVEKIVGGLTELTRDRPMFVHFDSIGILYLGGKNIGITFNINAVDTAGFQQLLANERGMIIGMINSAVNDKGQSNLI